MDGLGLDPSIDPVEFHRPVDQSLSLARPRRMSVHLPVQDACSGGASAPGSRGAKPQAGRPGPASSVESSIGSTDGSGGDIVRTHRCTGPVTVSIGSIWLVLLVIIYLYAHMPLLVVHGLPSIQQIWKWNMAPWKSVFQFLSSTNEY